MKVLQVLFFFFLLVLFALFQQPVDEGLNQRNRCAATRFRATRPEDSKGISLIFPQTCSSRAGYVCEPLLYKGHQTGPSSNLNVNFDQFSSLIVNITLSQTPANYNHQNIVIMEDDPVVVESASFLFEKQPSKSTLLNYQNGTLHVIRGSEVNLTKKCRVVLVGHGSKGSDGASRLGGYGPEEIAKVVGSMVVVGRHIQTLSLVGCDLGSDLQFAKKLLGALRNLNVETKLHFWRSAVSVSPSGEKLTMDGDVWRHRDSSKEVIAWLDERETLLTRVETGKRGKIIHSYNGHPLYLHTLEWPSHPQMFVPADLRKKYKTIDCLEGLTWSLFFEEHEKRRASDFVQANVLPVWLSNGRPKEGTSIKHITSILDLVLEIRYNAREDVHDDMYYVLNNFIFKVKKGTFYSSLVGKFINSNRQQEIQNFLDDFETQKDHYTIPELRQDLKASELNEFCRQTFQVRHCELNCGRWGRFFMEAVFSASVRNFRTFSLFLMSVIACEVSRSRGSDDLICSAFVGDDYPMLHDDPWPFHGRRGFYGCTLESNEKTIRRERVYWLDEVVAKEDSLYSRSKQMMSGVDHDQETELAIFGKVKVMNKYAFASFLEFFRGTVEGKKLTRGCIEPSTYDMYE